tara:strand:+ start:1418 stop:1666 length:249 start_codon:yes stop_codon:yes gene_type:complete
MAPIDEAVKEMKSQELGEELSFRKFAWKFDVSRTTLMRRCKGRQHSMAARTINQQKLSPQQEAELVEYIKSLTGEAFHLQEI